MTERKDVPSGLAGFVYLLLVLMVAAIFPLLSLVLVVLGIVAFIGGIFLIPHGWVIGPVLIGIAWLLFYLGEEVFTPRVIEWGNRTVDRQKRNPKK